MGMGKGMGMSMGLGKPGSPGPGGGAGADNSNTGPKGKIHDVKDISKSSTQVGDSGMVFSAGESQGAPDVASPASVPYTDVLPKYSKAAEIALSKEKVPPAYKTRVKQYFSSLENK